jgi:putative MATE family efflux protein
MKDLTQGSISRHLIQMAVPIAAGMLLQTMYFIVDLYFVSRLGDAALAGVSAGGNLMFIVFALTQMLGVGTVAMVSHATGRKDQREANHVFNQAVGLAAVCTLLTLVGGYIVAGPYMRFLGADAATMAAGMTFLYWLIPGLALQFAIIVMGSALRGTGIVKPGMVVQMLTVVLNAILAPILIAGWGTGVPLGVAGAALATSLSTAAGVVVLVIYFVKLEHYVGFDAKELRPDLKTWGRMLNIGLPAGGEFALLSVFTGIMYWAIRDFGAAAQAGFGIGARIMQMIFLPAMALAFAAAPIAGQNFGAKNPARVRETFRVAAIYGAIAMASLTALVQWKAEWFAQVFTSEPAVIAVSSEFLRYISWNFVAIGIVFTCSSLFQALGNTWPALASTSIRLLAFAVPSIWMAHQPWFQLRHIFTMSVVTVVLQALVSYLWLRREFRLRL